MLVAEFISHALTDLPGVEFNTMFFMLSMFQHFWHSQYLTIDVNKVNEGVIINLEEPKTQMSD